MEVGESPKPEVIRTNDELYRFLLPDSPNARRLSGSDLGWEVGIVGVKANRHPEARYTNTLKRTSYSKSTTRCRKVPPERYR